MRSPAEGADAGATPARVISGSLAKRQATGLQNRRYGFESHGSHRKARVAQRIERLASNQQGPGSIPGAGNLEGAWASKVLARAIGQ